MSEDKKDKPNLESKFKQAFKFIGPQLVAQIVGGSVAADKTSQIMGTMRKQELDDEQRIERRKLEQAQERRAQEKESREERSLQVRERGSELREQELDVASDREATRREELTQQKYERAVERFTKNKQIQNYEEKTTLLNDIDDIIRKAPEIASGVIGFKIAKGIAGEVGNLTEKERADAQVTPSFLRRVERAGAKFFTGKLPKKAVDELKRNVKVFKISNAENLGIRIDRVAKSNADYVDPKRFSKAMYSRFGINEILKPKKEAQPKQGAVPEGQKIMRHPTTGKRYIVDKATNKVIGEYK